MFRGAFSSADRATLLRRVVAVVRRSSIGARVAIQLGLRVRGLRVMFKGEELRDDVWFLGLPLL